MSKKTYFPLISAIKDYRNPSGGYYETFCDQCQPITRKLTELNTAQGHAML